MKSDFFLFHHKILVVPTAENKHPVARIPKADSSLQDHED